MQFTTRNLDAPKHLHCPCCKGIIFIATANSGETPDGENWLDDGDTVGKLWNLLSEAQQKPSGWHPMLMVGKCALCDARYYVFLASLMDADFEDVDSYLLGETDTKLDRYSACALTGAAHSLPAEWLLRENNTDAGILHEHMFGPFLLEDTAGVIGANGVSSCGAPSAQAWDHAAQVIATLWDDMRQLVRDRNDAIEPA